MCANFYEKIDRTPEDLVYDSKITSDIYTSIIHARARQLMIVENRMKLIFEQNSQSFFGLVLDFYR